MLKSYLVKPPLYEKGNSVMWTDKYISEQLLQIHLNPETDLASRSAAGMAKTLELILHCCNGENMQILDLGCGPGLYTEKLAEAGHRITGIDFSENSIQYASGRAKEKDLPIEYHCQDYLTIDYESRYDLVIMIYTDFGVLLPEERSAILRKIHRALKPGGIFVFDVINEKNLDLKFRENKTWNYEAGGFWNAGTYLEIQAGYHYPAEKVFLQQHVIIDQSGNVKDYRFWTRYFENDEIFRMLAVEGFHNSMNYENILPSTGAWDGDNITFYKTVKK